MNHRFLSLTVFPGAFFAVLAGSAPGNGTVCDCGTGEENDSGRVVSVLENIIMPDDSLFETSGMDSVLAIDASIRYSGLSDEDFNLVAKELDVEVAAIRAVVAIEAGKDMKGFWAPGVPVVNFDNTMYSRFRKKVKSSGAKGEKVPSGLKGYALREWTQLINARKTNARAANMGTFWGMFQIGGFNYAKCGCESVDEFVKLMAYSELSQLELFAAFIKNSGMLSDLRNKNWAGFARKYNGAGYAKRGYHKKMAAAYKRFSAREKGK